MYIVLYIMIYIYIYIYLFIYLYLYLFIYVKYVCVCLSIYVDIGWDRRSVKLDLACSADFTHVLSSVENVLSSVGAHRKYGQAPRGGLERQAQELLDALKSDQGDGVRGFHRTSFVFDGGAVLWEG